MKKIPIPVKSQIRWVAEDHIIWFEAVGKTTNVYLIDGTIISSSKMLKHYSEAFHRRSFYRIHDKYLVNITHVYSRTKVSPVSIIMVVSGKQCVWNSTTLPVSFRKKRDFLEFIQIKMRKTLIEETTTLIAKTNTLIPN